LAIAVILSAVPAFAQQGQINGVIIDSSGGVIPGVTVTAIESGTGISRETLTGANGRYQFPSLRPTTYELRAELAGFRTIRRTDVLLQANQNLTLNITLELGDLSETITVAGEAASVDVTTATISEVVDHARIVELPLNGRDAAKLTTLVAGTVLASISTETGKSIPGGLRLTSNGSEEKDVAFRLDGTSNNDPYFQENQTFPFPEALQEFSIQTSNYSAAQGNQAGAVVNAVTRSGTNAFHGGSFGYVRDKTFNAKPFFGAKDELKRKQYGGYLGGPVKLPGYNGTNRTFFFTGWQGTLIDNVGSTTNVNLPTDDMRRGDFSTCGQACNVAIRDPLTGQPFPNKQIPVSRFDPAIVNLLKYLPSVQGDGLYQVPRPTDEDLNQFVLKIDQQLSSNNQLSNRYFIDHFDHAASYTPGNLATYRGGTLQSRVRTQNNVTSWRRTFTSTLLNETHFGYNRVHARRAPPDSSVPTLQELGIRLPLYPTLPSLQGLPFGIGDNLEGSFVRNGYEFGSKTSWMKGKHSIQFGGEIQYYTVEIINEYRRGGNYTFGTTATGMSLADIMLGDMTRFEQGTGEYKDNRARYYSLFAQDDYKISQRVSLNLGVRWEPAPPWREHVGRFQQFRLEDYRNNVRSTLFDNAPPGLMFRGDPGVPYDGTNIDWANVGARVGMAYDLTGDGKTSIRGGWGMFYDQQLDGEFYNVGVNSPPWSITTNIVEPQGPFSDPYRGRTAAEFNAVTPAAIGRRDAAFPQPVQANGYDEKFTTPVTYNFNVTFERELLAGWMARAAYVASRMREGRSTIQLNPAVNGPGATTNNTDARRLIVPYGGINQYTQDDFNNYDSMQLTLNRRLSNSWTFNTNYTASVSDGVSLGLIPYNLPQDPDLVLTSSSRHRLVASWVYELPDIEANRILNGVFGGWQLTGVYQFQSGGWLSIESGTDRSLDGLGGDRAVRIDGVPLEVQSTQTCGTPPCVFWFNSAAFRQTDPGTWGSPNSMNVMRGPSATQTDLGIFKNFRFTNDTGVQFRAEFFNVFNNVNFGNPNTSVSSGNFGRITGLHGVFGSPRIVQFGLKFVF
jgi:hypothetical protein